VSRVNVVTPEGARSLEEQSFPGWSTWACWATPVWSAPASLAARDGWPPALL